jgi:hypothetical protein
MKRKILFFLLVLTLIMGCGAVIFTVWLPNAVPAGETVSVAVEAEEEYLVRAENDLVCVYQNGELICATGIRVTGLPQGDRTLLEEGITVRGGAEVAALLEDLGA